MSGPTTERSLRVNLLANLLATARKAAGDDLSDPLTYHIADTKLVRKGWGEERWLVTEAAPFGFKLIYIRAGQRTSLQYHAKKEEANLVLHGEGVLHFAERAGDSVHTRQLVAGQIVHVHPGTVHRVEATTDLTIVEVSTTELDDVIRIQDDWNRNNGRIASEHQPEPRTPAD